MSEVEVPRLRLRAEAVHGAEEGEVPETPTEVVPEEEEEEEGDEEALDEDILSPSIAESADLHDREEPGDENEDDPAPGDSGSDEEEGT